jgi:hypothetical protein
VGGGLKRCEERAVSRKATVEGCEDGKVVHGKWHYLFILIRGCESQGKDALIC